MGDGCRRAARQSALPIPDWIEAVAIDAGRCRRHNCWGRGV